MLGKWVKVVDRRTITHVIKTKVKVNTWRSDGAFKAMLGQRGIVYKEMEVALTKALDSYEEFDEVTLRITHRKESKFELLVVGPTSTYLARCVVGQLTRDTPISSAMISAIYDRRSGHWNRLAGSQTGARGLIFGKLISMGFIGRDE